MRLLSALKITLAVLLTPVVLLAGLYGWWRFINPEGYELQLRNEREANERRQVEIELEQALARREQESGPNHPLTAESLQKLGRAYTNHGHYEKAQPLLERALAIHERAVAPLQPAVADILSDLAYIHSLQKGEAQAEALLLRALQVRESALGPEHRDVARDLRSLGYHYRDKKDFAQAEANFRRALAIDEKLADKGEDALTQALLRKSLEGLAGLYYLQGRLNEAESLYARVLAIERRYYAPDHPVLEEPVLNLADTHVGLKRYADAEPLYVQVLRMTYRDKKPIKSARALEGLAKVYRETGRAGEAEPLEKKAKAIRTRE